MKLIKNISRLAPVLTIMFLLFSAVNSFSNPVDSDLSNRAGTNSGNSHLDIYIFIVALLVLCVVIPFFEKKNNKSSTN